MLRRKWWLDFPGEWTCSYAIGAGRGCGLCCLNGCIMLYRNIWIVVFCVHSFRPPSMYTWPVRSMQLSSRALFRVT